MDQATLTNASLQSELERLRVQNRTLGEENRHLRQSRDASQRSEQRYRILTENTLDLIYEVSQHGIYTYVSPNHFEALGYRPKELLGQNFSVHIHRDDVDGIVEKFSKCIVGGLPYVATFRVQHKDSSWRWMETTGKPLETATAPGTPPYEGQAVFVSRDITERLETRRALATGSERLAVMLRSIADGVMATDLDGRIVQTNDAACRLLGIKCDDLVGQLVEDSVQFLEEGSRAPLQNPLAQTLEDGTESRLPLAGYALLRSQTNVEFVVAGSAAPIRDHEDNLQGAVLVFRNITDRRRTEQELLKLNKQESLGQLAARIAHDFNNLLTVILGNLSLAKILLAPGDAALRRLVDTEKACLRATDLTRQLLAFARGGLPVKKSLAMEPMVRESARLIMQDSAVPYRLNWLAPLPMVQADAEQMHQLLFELLTNAAHATPKGGTIHLRGEAVHLDGNNTLPLPTGDYVRLAVRDEGMGIPEQHLTRIFEPFFTTKENARGLGLATCFLIARNHDGFMTVDSTPGSGTEFHLYLPALPLDAQPIAAPVLDRPPLSMRPAAEAPVNANGSNGVNGVSGSNGVSVVKPAPVPVAPPTQTPMAAPAAAPQAVPELKGAKGSRRKASAGRILVMDDEAPICELAAELLGRNGYEVHTANEGAEAVRKYVAAQKDGQPFDVVILDLTVRNGLGGLETITQLKQADPHVKAIVSSGYSQDPIMSRYREHGFSGAATKPYSISELLHEVEQVSVV